MTSPAYSLSPLAFGAREVTGIDLKQPVDEETIARIEEDVTK